MLRLRGFLSGAKLSRSEGLGMANKEDTELVELAKKAQSGDAEAQYSLASQFFEQGNLKIAEKWFNEAAAQGHTEAQYRLGSFYLNGATSICKGYGVKYITTIENLLRQAAEKGHKAALIELTPLYLTESLPTYDLEKAAYWAPKAAATGDAISIFNLAELYKEGKCEALGGKPDMEKYAELVKQAADKKLALALYALGELEEAKGTKEGDAEAFKLYMEAALQDHAPAQFKVALCFYQGKGVEQDRELGEEWLTYVAEYGYEPALEEIRNNPDYELEIKQLSATQLAARRGKANNNKKKKGKK